MFGKHYTGSGQERKFFQTTVSPFFLPLEIGWPNSNHSIISTGLKNLLNGINTVKGVTCTAAAEKAAEIYTLKATAI